MSPKGQKVWLAKKRTNEVITPTTAQLIPVSGPESFNSERVDSTNGPPRKIKQKDGKKINQLAMMAPRVPDKKAESPMIACDCAQIYPTNATIRINGPGVVSPNASPSIICKGVNQ